MPAAVPTALADFPDIEHLPVYPNASVRSTDKASDYSTRITYEVVERMDTVAEFYQETLPKMGWQWRLTNSRRNRYSWTNPAEKPLWHMHLDVTLDLSLDKSKTVVVLRYGRYPNIEEGLLLYPDAQQVAITRSDILKHLAQERLVHVTDVTYLSNANLQEIADFYINSMQEYGWYMHEPGWSTGELGSYPFDSPGSWELDNQTGGSKSQEGLYFVAVRPNWDQVASTVAYHLLATATVQEDGRAVIKLHVEEFEIPPGNI